MAKRFMLNPDQYPDQELPDDSADDVSNDEGPVDLKGDEDSAEDSEDMSGPSMGGGIAKEVPSMTPASLRQIMPDAPAPSKGEPAKSKASDLKPDDYMISKKDLQDYTKKQQKNSIISALAEGQGSNTGWGGMYLGRQVAHPNYGGAETAANERAQMPMVQKQQAMHNLQAMPGFNLMRPDSQESQAVKERAKFNLMAAAQGPAFKDNPQLQNIIQGYNQMIDKAPNGMVVQKMMEDDKFLNGLMSAGAKGQIAQQGQNSRASLAAQRTVNNDKILNTYIPRLDGAQKIMNLISAGERGEFKTNGALLGQLNAEIARLETGSQSPGLHASEKTEMLSLAAKLHGLADAATGNVSSVDLKNQFAQARGMVGDLGASYRDQIDKRMNTLKAGSNLPGQKEVFDEKHQDMMNNYKAFEPKGQMAGGSPFGGSAQAGEPKRSVSAQEIQDYAKKYGMDPQAAAKWLESQGHGVGR